MQKIYHGTMGRTHPYNKRGSTRRGRTNASSTAWDPPSPVYATTLAVQRERRGVFSRRANADPLEDRSVCAPPTRKPPPPSHRACYVPEQVRRAACSTGQSVKWNAPFLIKTLIYKSYDRLTSMSAEFNSLKLKLSYILRSERGWKIG